MAFQDFDLINERRKSEKRAQMRKRIIIGVISSVVFVGLIGCAFFVATTKYSPFGGGGGGSRQTEDTTASGSKHVAHSEKVVKLVCSSADYKEKCEGPLNKAVEKDPKLQHPKDLLKVYLKTVEDEVNKAFNKTNSFKFNTKEEKAAFEDCKEMIQYAKDDLATSIDQLSEADMKKLSSKTPDLNSWLSAVITFQETCVDGFPDGKLKTDLQKLFQGSREFVSNSLAIVSQVSTFLSSLQTMGAPRMLLSDNSPVASMDSEGIPSWIQSEERRVLKAADIRPKPNVVVAKDGSGNFRTISAALAAIPPNFRGRYIYIRFIFMH
jgi:pectinesterase inhibitor-like protein